jgi:hypothetical protein
MRNGAKSCSVAHHCLIRISKAAVFFSLEFHLLPISFFFLMCNNKAGFPLSGNHPSTTCCPSCRSPLLEFTITKDWMIGFCFSYCCISIELGGGARAKGHTAGYFKGKLYQWSFLLSLPNRWVIQCIFS